MIAHPPKWNALHALEQGLLSAEAERRLGAHLLGCDECSRALAVMRLYARATEAAQEQRTDLSTDAWERLERAIKRDAVSPPAAEPLSEPNPEGAYDRISAEVRMTPAPTISTALADKVLRRRERERQDRAWAWLSTLSAAACFALAFQLFGATREESSRPQALVAPTVDARASEAQPAAAPEARALDVHVRALSGNPWTDEARLRLGARVEEGQRCETGEHDSAHFSVGPDSGFALSAEGVTVITRARVDGVLLTLERGALSSSVASGTPYSVHAAPFEFEVRGTRFSVARRTDGSVAARVAEGSVAVLRGGELLALLGPGDEWSSAGPSFAPEPHVWSPEAGVSLHIPATDRSPFVTFEADSVIWDARSDTVLTAREGASIRLTFFDARGRATTLDTRPVAEGTTVEAPVPSRLARGHLPATVLSSVVRAHRGDLDFCVARAVRMAARELGDVTLRLTITPEGVVSDVQVVGPGASQPLRACLSAKARGWVFPRPGGSLPVQAQTHIAISPG